MKINDLEDVQWILSFAQTDRALGATPRAEELVTALEYMIDKYEAQEHELKDALITVTRAQDDAEKYADMVADLKDEVENALLYLSSDGKAYKILTKALENINE